MALNDCNDFELEDRYQTVFKEFVEMAPDVAKLLDKFARTKQELQLLLDEMRKRKLSTEHPDYKDSNAPKTDNG